jgi:urea transport system ATP-binding protein
MKGSENLLEIKHLSVDFKGFQVIDDVSFGVKKGELRVIIGPNGAGKTTLMDMITGKTKPTYGSITIDNKEISKKDPSVISSRFKIGRKFQGPNVFDNMTVYDNILMSISGHSTVFRTMFFRKTKEIEKKVQEILQFINLSEVQEISAVNLSHGQRQWLEIGMVIAQDPDLIVLDEPTAGMTAAETYKTGELILKLKETGKHTLIVIEHDMDFIRQIAETVTVLYQGKFLAEGTFDEIAANPQVVQVYLKDSDDAEEEAV